MKWTILMLLIALLIVAGCSTQGKTEVNAQNGPIKELKIESYNWGFNVNEVEINKGDRVRLTLTSTSGTHGITIPELGVTVPPVSPGQEQVVEFVAEKSGKFDYYCNIMCGQGHGNMRGSFTIK